MLLILVILLYLSSYNILITVWWLLYSRRLLVLSWIVSRSSWPGLPAIHFQADPMKFNDLFLIIFPGSGAVSNFQFDIRHVWDKGIRIDHCCCWLLFWIQRSLFRIRLSRLRGLLWNLLSASVFVIWRNPDLYFTSHRDQESKIFKFNLN